MLQEARRALARLYSPCCSRPLAPVAFLTNGGGMLEEDRADALTRMLGVKVTADQVRRVRPFSKQQESKASVDGAATAA